MDSDELTALCICIAVLVLALLAWLFNWWKKQTERHIDTESSAEIYVDLESGRIGQSPSISVVTGQAGSTDSVTPLPAYSHANSHQEIHANLDSNDYVEEALNRLRLDEELRIYRAYAKTKNKSTPASSGTDFNYNQTQMSPKLPEYIQTNWSKEYVAIQPNGLSSVGNRTHSTQYQPGKAQSRVSQVGTSKVTANQPAIFKATVTQPLKPQPKTVVIKPTPLQPQYRPKPGPKSWQQKTRDQYHQNSEERLMKIRDIQERHVVSPEFLKSLNCDLLICVDARPKAIGGYCIEMNTRTCEFYSYNSNVLPWELRDKSITGNSGEFEMKNMLFALLLWESKILSYRRVEIHTDNPAIQPNENNEYGYRVQTFIHHLRQCRGIKIQYKVTNCRRFSNYEDFARFIQPADDLSRNRIFDATVYLQGIYSIQDFSGAYESGDSLEHYNNFQMKVKRRVRKWSKHPCPCGFQIDYSDSLRMSLRP